MPSSKASLRGPLLRTLAALFAAVTVLYGISWMYYIRFQTTSGELGFISAYSTADRAVVVEGVEEASPAAQAGLQAGDRITAVDEVPLDTRRRFVEWEHSRADAMVLTVVRQGSTAPLRLPPPLAAFVRGYRAIGLYAIPALFYGFFAVFPARSPIDRKLPWLKWLLVVGWIIHALPGLLGRGLVSRGLLAGWIGEPAAAAI